MSNYFNGSGTIGFTCDNCGRETQGCILVNGMKFCAKCYQETFGNNNMTENLINMYDAYSKVIAEKDQKIAILEKALELACKELHVELENPDNELYTKTSDEYVEYFKTKAKDMMKSE